MNIPENAKYFDGQNQIIIRLDLKKRIGVDRSVGVKYNFPVSKDAFLLGTG